MPGRELTSSTSAGTGSLLARKRVAGTASVARKPQLVDSSSNATVMIARLALLLAGYDLVVFSGASAALLILAALTPTWWPQVRAYAYAPVILLFVVACPIYGLYLAKQSAFDHSIAVGAQRAAILNFFSGAAVMVATLWGRRLMPFHHVALWYGFGAIADAMLNSERSWKFHLAVPCTIFIIGGLANVRRRLVPAAAIMVLGLYGILDEGRSYFGFCLVAAAVTVWQMRPRTPGKRSNRWYPLALLAGIGLGIYSVVSSLLTSGYFGPVLQQRSVAQIDATGSLIAGGRPEWSATRALFRHRPRGYGISVVPNYEDVMIAKSGLASINVDTGGYLTHYMMGGQFRLHSIMSDLWSAYGFVGIALGLIVIYALARSLSSMIAANVAPTIVIFICILAFWHMAFGPLYTNWPDAAFALGLVLPVVREERLPLVSRNHQRMRHNAQLTGSAA